MCQALLPWLGVRESDPESVQLRRVLATGIAPVVGTDTALRRTLVDKLQSISWQERQGAAWALIEAGDEVRHDEIASLRRLLDDEHAEESWLERLQAAAALVNHADRELSQKAVQVACEALAYGPEAWHLPLSSLVHRLAANVMGTIEPIKVGSDIISQLAQKLENEDNEFSLHSLYEALLRFASVYRPLS